ncbi:MAG: hypothetical protein REI78_08370 [Pedobacter sp.]|nr:hypothetical protein [Pedobacter sp.]MDQ8053028.1 hypothetical protein [Pedobacter sp.]
MTKSKNLSILMYSLGLLLLIVISCRKDIVTHLIANQEAKLSSWYQSHVNLAQDNPFNKLVPDWGNSVLTEDASNRIYEIPVQNPERLTIVSDGTPVDDLAKVEKNHLIKLLIFENKISGKILYGAYMLVEGTSALKESDIRYKKLGDLTGTVFFYHINGKMANGWTYENGRIKKQLTVLSKESFEAAKSSANGKTMEYQCINTLTPVYVWGCTGVEGHEECRYHFNRWEYVSNCRFVENEGMEGELDHPDQGGGGYTPTIIFDCAGVANGSAYISSFCNKCIMGTTGFSGCPPISVKVSDSLKNNFPCLEKLVMNKLRTDTAFNKLLEPFSPPAGEVPDIVYTYSSQNYGTGNYYQLGETEHNGWSSIVSFNSLALSNSSELFIAMAVIHETAHAYSNYYVRTGSYGRPAVGLTWAMNIVDYEKAKREQAQNSNAFDHSLFLETYFDNMVSILATYFGNSFTMDQYRMAAIYGLDNPGPTPTDPNELAAYNTVNAALQGSYTRIRNKYNLSTSSINSFNSANLISVSTPLKMPTSCP